MNRGLVLLALALGVTAGCTRSSPPPAQATPPTTPQPAAQSDPEAWRAQVPEPGPAGQLDVPAPDTARLDNGLHVYSLRRAAGVVSIGLVVRHGAGSVREGKSGLAALTTRMLTEGTRRRSSLELAEAAEALGTTLAEDAGRDYSSVWMTVLREDFGRGLDLLAEVVEEPAFDPGELRRVRAEWIEHLRDERQDPRRVATLAGLRLLLGPVLGSPVHGSIEDVGRLDVRDLREFHARAFTPANAALVVVGDISPDQARSEAQRALGGWRGQAWPPAAAAPLPPPPAQLRVAIVDRPGAVQSAIFFAQSFPNRAAPGHEARELLGTLFGGLFTSRINQNLREEHAYTYGASARAVATRDWGAFIVSTTVETRATPAALQEIRRELELVRAGAQGKPVREEEVSRASAALVSALGERLETTSDLGEDLATLFHQGLPHDYFARYGALVGAVSRDDVQREATQRLEPAHAVVVIVGDRAMLDGPLRATGVAVETAPPSLLD